MRTPTNTLGRSHSPNSPRNKHAASASSKPPPTAEEVARSTQSLETHVKDISNALKHFCDVILKKKLEVLPGNGTVILETIASLYAVIQSYTLNENSAVLRSATQQVYQSLGKLIKLCDEVMLCDENSECASLSSENVREVVDLLEAAVRNLVTLAQIKLKEREENAFKYGPSTPELNAGLVHNNHLMRPPVEAAGQRTSLPDITLTPKERDILEKTKSNPIRASHSTESILRDTSPPPKPPLPNSRTSNPPPLPPKRRSQQQQQQQQQNQNSNNISINSDLDCSSEFSLMNYGVDHLSVRSRSPDENSSQCSLDSALNHSREEDELKSLGLESRFEENLLEDDVEKFIAFKATTTETSGIKAADDDKTAVLACNKTGVGASAAVAGVGGALSAATISTLAAGMQNVAAATVMTAVGSVNVDNNSGKADMRTAANNRHSNESGFVSMKSFRTSTQSVSKRSSDYSFQSTATKSSSNSEFGEMTTEFLTKQQQQQQLMQTANSTTTTTTTTTTKTSSLKQEEQQTSTRIYTTAYNNSAATTKTTTATTTGSGDDNHSISNTSSASPEHFERAASDKLLLSQLHSMSSLTKTNSLDISSTEELLTTHTSSSSSFGMAAPPALPPKVAPRLKERNLSQYDNAGDEVDDANSFSAHELPELRHQQQQQQHIYQLQTKHQSLMEPRRNLAASCNAIGGIFDGNGEEPPPLPMKKKHILAYMEICAATRTYEQHRHTMHTYNTTNRNITHSQTMNIVPLSKELTTPEQETPPALPPKNYKQRKPTATPPTIITTPPPSPKPMHLSADNYNDGMRHGRVLSGTQGSELMSTVCEEMADFNDDEQSTLHHSHNLPDAQRQADANVCDSNKSPTRFESASLGRRTPICTPELVNNEEDDEGIDVVLENHSFNNKKHTPNDNLPNMLEEIDITPYLIFKKENEDGPEIKGGYIDALIVHASHVQKVSEGMFKGPAFSEAFITTFRTFIQPIDVIEKLTHRYTVFFCQSNDQRQKAAKETFSLLVRVVNDLTPADLTSQLQTLLVEFVYQLVCSGQLYQAKLLRNTIVEKVHSAKEQKMPSYLPATNIKSANQTSLLDLKSIDIAEQMTLLDAELFVKIEIPEVLLFAKEQCEEKSPNLNKFTEHFNKMSYWARSKILQLSDAKEREKHVIKFIKIMKHLRKMNNYNSYLALLSALDSAPIRRLEWHKTITEGLKEYCTLIDSSSSFRVYRQALAETNPPCIPYIGLVLQDLTFVHVGNPDYLKEGVINFSKRWQQYNIIVNMKRFKKCTDYKFRRNENIINFFGNFEQFLGEEEMWKISETIKPRRSKRQLLN